MSLSSTHLLQSCCEQKYKMKKVNRSQRLLCKLPTCRLLRPGLQNVVAFLARLLASACREG
jgi:hypothetical protein